MTDRRVAAAPRPHAALAALLVLLLALSGARTDAAEGILPLGSDGEPAWSPDGRRIAFAVWGRGPTGIAVMNADGTARQRLTSGAACPTQDVPDAHCTDVSPDWSPNGRLVFARSGAGIFVMNAEGRGLTRLTTNAQDLQPAWSPDGRLIAFSRNRPVAGGFETALWVTNPDGSGQRVVTSLQGLHYGSSWSPDSRRIIFQDAPAGRNGLYLVNADGTGRRLLKELTGVQLEPSWSPDGRQIAYSGDDDPGVSTPGISVMNADGTGARRLTHHSEWDRWPDWSPDGTRIAYSGGPRYLYVHIMRRDGSADQTLAARPARPAPPAGPTAIRGTEGPDVLVGTPGDDRIRGKGGNDRIDGRGGNDRIDGGPGNDVIDGGSGHDQIAGDEGGSLNPKLGRGNDRLNGGTGNDDIGGGPGSDVLVGGVGNDILAAGDYDWADRVDGGPGRDAAQIDKDRDTAVSIEKFIPLPRRRR